MTVHDMVVAEMAAHGFKPCGEGRPGAGYAGYMCTFTEGRQDVAPVVITAPELRANSSPERLAHLVKHRAACVVHGYRERCKDDGPRT